MKSPNAADLETARRLLACEEGEHEHHATSAVRAFDKLYARLAPLLGSTGVNALFLRSLKLAKLDDLVVPERTVGDAESAVSPGKYFHDYLGTLEVGPAAEASALVFANFFALLTTLIGEKLTRQLLRGAWPDIAAAAPKESER